jgi:tetratricopeptide (TPR) repeat protein
MDHPDIALSIHIGQGREIGIGQGMVTADDDGDDMPAVFMLDAGDFSYDLPESLSPEMILAQLERIVSSTLFVKKRQLCGFLTYIVAETLAGNSERLKGYTIALDVFGRNPDFNPQLNPVVRVRANQLRKALQRYYLTGGSNDPIRIDVPNYATILAMLADLSGQLFFLGMRDESVLDQAEILARQSISLEPNHQHAHWVAGWFHFLKFQAELCIKELEIALSLNPNHANLLGAAAYLLAMIGQWDRGLSLMQKAMRLNPHHPGWYRFVVYLNHYRFGEYEAALNETLRINSPQFYIDPLSRAAVLGRLGRIPQANSALQELLSLMPAFADTGKKQLRIVVFSKEHVEMLWEGLLKAELATKG